MRRPGSGNDSVTAGPIAPSLDVPPFRFRLRRSPNGYRPDRMRRDLQVMVLRRGIGFEPAPIADALSAANRGADSLRLRPTRCVIARQRSATLSEGGPPYVRHASSAPGMYASRLAP